MARLGALKPQGMKKSADGDLSLPATTCPPGQSNVQRGRDATRAAQRPEKLQQQQPCGPLIGDPALSPPPRTLLLGLTASTLPEDPAMAYSERSFWKVCWRPRPDSGICFLAAIILAAWGLLIEGGRRLFLGKLQLRGAARLRK